MRRVLAAAAFLWSVLFVAAPARAADCTQPHCVKITDTAFTPASISVPLNGDVFWCPDDSNQKTHNVHFPGYLKPNNDIPPGSGCTWHTFTDEGTFNYQCDL